MKLHNSITKQRVFIASIYICLHVGSCWSFESSLNRFYGGKTRCRMYRRRHPVHGLSIFFLLQQPMLAAVIDAAAASFVDNLDAAADSEEAVDVQGLASM